MPVKISYIKNIAVPFQSTKYIQRSDCSQAFFTFTAILITTQAYGEIVICNLKIADKSRSFKTRSLYTGGIEVRRFITRYHQIEQVIIIIIFRSDIESIQRKS